uniref:Glycosyltransferase family 92 protein n=1 Tax=Steinernema glaseri TaxID=37863 RepID=A0A1I7YGI7_9BILA
MPSGYVTLGPVRHGSLAKPPIGYVGKILRPIIFLTLSALLLFFLLRHLRTSSYKSDAFLVVNSYYQFVSDDLVGFQAIGFSRLRPLNATESWFLILGDEKFPLEAQCIKRRCRLGEPCKWNDYRLKTTIPRTVDLDQAVYIQHNDDRVRIDITVKNPNRRIEGMDVCIAPLYYFNHWVRVIEFVEFYKMQGASHMYIYVSSVSKTVHAMLKYYQKQGVLTVVYWPELPKVDNEVHGRFRLGQEAAVNDCALRSRAKFVVNGDMDDWFFIRDGNETLLEFVTRHVTEDPTIGSFQFFMLFTHQESRVGDLSDWKKINFNGLREADICDTCNDSFKNIFVADASTRLNAHQVFFRRLPDQSGRNYTIYEVPREVGRDFHVRFAMFKGWDKKDLYERRPLFPQSVVDAISRGFDTAMEEFTKTHKNLTIPSTAQTMQDCNPFSNCMNPYKNCARYMDHLDEWIFANNTEHAAVHDSSV